MAIDTMNQPFLQNPGGAPVVAPVQQQQQGITPEMIAKIAAGRNAQRGLGSLSNNPANIQALRNANTPYSEVQGKGHAATAPSFLEVLGRTALRGRGEMDLASQAKEANALRGATAEGEAAELEAKYAQDAAAQQAKIAAAEAKVRADQDAALEQHNRTLSRDELQNNRRVAAAEIKRTQDVQDQMRAGGMLKSGFSTYYDPATGQTKNVATTNDGGVIDEDRQKTSIEGMVPYDDYVETLGVDSAAIGNMSNTHKTDLAGYYSGKRQLNDINDIARAFTDEDRAALDKPGLNSVIKAMTPANFETYVNSELKGLTPRAKQYLTRVNEFSSGLRNQLFGSALTVNETVLSETFLQSPVGIGLDDQLARADSINSMFDARIQGIDDVYGTKFADKGVKYKSASETPQSLPTKNAKGWTLQTDANGNQAYVSADGSEYEEVGDGV